MLAYNNAIIGLLNAHSSWLELPERFQRIPIVSSQEPQGQMTNIKGALNQVTQRVYGMYYILRNS